MPLKEITVRELVDVIRSMNNTAAGHDGIPTHIVKKVALLIAPVLADIFNSSLMLGIFPDLLKVTKIIPILKNGDKCDIKKLSSYIVINIFQQIVGKTHAT